MNGRYVTLWLTAVAAWLYIVGTVLSKVDPSYDWMITLSVPIVALAATVWMVHGAARIVYWRRYRIPKRARHGLLRGGLLDDGGEDE